MNVFLVNGSPRGAQGNTAILDRAFCEGAAEEGASCETVYLKDKTINYCTGCYTCWLKTPGVCIHRDDMPELLEKMKRADVIVFSTPLYIYTVSGLMKDFLDRILPLVDPYIDIRDGLCGHPARDEISRPTASVLISNCGFPEQEHFSALREMFRQLFRASDRFGLAGMICCSGGPMLSSPMTKDMVAWYVEATKQAGREVARNLTISPDTQAILDRPLITDTQAYVDVANGHFRSSRKAAGIDN